MKLAIFGPPGSGKGTYASRLQSILGTVQISTGDMLRETAKEDTELGRKAAESTKNGDLLLEDVVTEMLKQRLNRPDAKKGFVLDGYPRTIGQAKALEGFAKLDAVIKLSVPEEIIIARLSARETCSKCGAIFNKLSLKSKVPGICDKCGGKLFQRDDDRPETIRKRLKIYEEQINPILDYYNGRVPIVEATCTELNTPPEMVVNKIVAGLKKIGL